MSGRLFRDLPTSLRLAFGISDGTISKVKERRGGGREKEEGEERRTEKRVVLGIDHYQVVASL